MAPAWPVLLDTLFASVLEDPPWVPFLLALEKHLQCHHCTMVMRLPREGDPGVLIGPSGDAEAALVMQQRLYRDSPFLELPEGRVCLLRELHGKREIAARYPAFAAYLRQYGNITDLIGVDLTEPLSGMTFRLRGARRGEEPLFGARERARLEALLPRLRTAIALYARIARQEYHLSVQDQTADRLAIASLVVDAEGRVLVKNLVADRMLAQRDGFELEGGRLRCVERDSDKALRLQLAALLRAAQSPQAPLKDHTLTVKRGGGRAWSVLLRPVRPGLGAGENTSVTVLLLVRDAARKPAIDDATLMGLFGLTRAESALAVRLVQGQSVIDAAAALGISRYTARAQLAAIFAKTGIHRQPQLVSHILGIVNSQWN